MPRIVCPGCGATADMPKLARSSDEFCRSCDFPLFWADGNVRPPDDDEPLGMVIRRQPGAGGRQLVAIETCPECQELNRPTAVYCQRCGAEMHPVPPPVQPTHFEPPVAPPAPTPAPALPAAATRAPPAPASWWRAWLVVALLLAILVTVAVASVIVLAART